VTASGWIGQLIFLLGSTVRLAVPLVLAALAGLFAERSGVVDIGLEGKMLGGAFAAAAAAEVTGSAWIGLLAAILLSVVLSLIHGFATITHRGDQVASGPRSPTPGSTRPAACRSPGRPAASCPSTCRSPPASARYRCSGPSTATW
jgi:hypothetical protein